VVVKNIRQFLNPTSVEHYWALHGLDELSSVVKLEQGFDRSKKWQSCEWTIVH
jgi:hypothetical protein